MASTLPAQQGIRKTAATRLPASFAQRHDVAGLILVMTRAPIALTVRRRMRVATRHRHLVQFSATILTFVLSTGSLFGQVGMLLRDNVHVCTCSADADHDCNCPHCAGPHVGTEDEAPCHTTGTVEEDEPPALPMVVEQVPCGELTGEATDLMAVRALIPAPPVRPSLPLLAATPTHRSPPAVHSRGADAPEPPPPQHA